MVRSSSGHEVDSNMRWGMRLEHVNQASAAAVHFASAEDSADLGRVFAGPVVQTSIGKVENDKDLPFHLVFIV